MKALSPSVSKPHRTAAVEELWRLMPRMESGKARTFPFGLPVLDSHLPHGGLTFGALHEIVPDTDGDLPAAFGFLVACLGRLSSHTVLLLALDSQFIQPSGHGLNYLGLDPARLIFVTTQNEKQTLWTLEEALRSGVPAAAAGVLKNFTFKTSQRLHIAAQDSGRLLLLLRAAPLLETSVAATRWRVAAASAARDQFGLIAGWRWHLKLERCRNGRPGEWLVEFDHVAHRFSLAPALADLAFSRRAEERPLKQSHRS